MFNRSLRTVVTDTFTAPRWVHHLVKVLTGAIVLLVLLGLLQVQRTWLAVSILSLLWLLTTKVSARLDRGDKWYTVGHDLACDLALHLLPVALLVGWEWSWLWGGVLAGLLAGLYLLTYPDAQP